MSDLLIQLRGVTKRYGSGVAELMALKGIDLDITPASSSPSWGRAARANPPR
jgi:hypothetical protein